MKFVFILVFLTTQAIAHSGRTDSSGCHNDHKNGGYHCHRADDTKIVNGTNRGPASIQEKSQTETNKKEKKVPKL